MRALLIAASLFLCSGILTGSAAAQVPLDAQPFWQSSEKNVYSTGMIWRDCNNDGYIDVFFSNGNDMARAANSIYISHYGELPAGASWYSSNLEYSGHCAVGDINDDGYPDFCVSNYLGSGRFSTKNFSNLYMNLNGSISTSPDWYNADSIYTFSCALGDPDGDGKLDLAFATGEGYGNRPDYSRIYFNVGGAFQTLPGWQSADSNEALDVTWGDVDNDGDLDLALCYESGGAAIYYNNAGTIESTPSWSSNVLEPANTLILGDVNGDDWLDLIVAFNYQTGGQGYYMAFYNDGTGQLQSYPSWQSSDGGYGSAIALYDYDNDGRDDLAAGRWWDAPRIYRNNGTGFTATPIWRAGNATVVEELAWVDVDGDGLEALADTFYTDGDKKVFYTKHHPLYSIDSVIADGTRQDNARYCYDLVSGWISMAYEPGFLIIYYQYSFKNDLAVSNWDTYNMVYGNNSKPLVDFYADKSIGFAPLTVQFSDSSIAAANWTWRFGDGGEASVKNPIHPYVAGGVYDVCLQNVLADGPHNHTNRKMIIALADTVYFPQVIFNPGQTVKIPIYLRNCHPLHFFVLPVTFGGPVGLSYLGYDTDSCVSADFDQVKMISFDAFTGTMLLSFVPAIAGSGKPPLEPGYGRLINIYFLHESGNGTNILDTTTIDSWSLKLNADYAEYQPAVKKGYISSTYVRKGDANGDGAINIIDITFLINYLYKGGPAPNLFAGDVDSNGSMNIFDVTYLVNYLYKGGPPPLK